MKTKTLHTLGPWEIRRLPSGHTAIYPEGKYDRVADVFSSPDYECEENKANARLIAAAPELLDALRLVDDILEKEADYHERHGDEEQRSFVRSALVAIRATIAKAEGRE